MVVFVVWKHRFVVPRTTLSGFGGALIRGVFLRHIPRTTKIGPETGSHSPPHFSGVSQVYLMLESVLLFSMAGLALHAGPPTLLHQ